MKFRFLDMTIALSLIAAVYLWPHTVLADDSTTTAEEQVTFYTAYGYKKDNYWIIPLRIWVHEKPDALRRLVARGAREIIKERAGLASLSQTQKHLYMSRVEGFIADSESNEEVVFQFDDDPDRETFVLIDEKGQSKTDRNGYLEGLVRLTTDKARRLLDAQNSRQGWLSYRAVSADHAGNGKVRLIEASGVSVISDIDDTVKITGITAGEPEVLKNTFFRDFAAAPCMAEMYRSFGHGAAYHYVSGGPWQLYGPLDQFLFSESAGFPRGSVHMKNVRTNPFESETYHDLWKLFADGSKQATFEQKMAQISALMAHFPERSFILIGDSGEYDPEVFRVIEKQFPGRVREIRIRDVADDQVHRPDRLEKMRIIAANVAPDGPCHDILKN